MHVLGEQTKNGKKLYSKEAKMQIKFEPEAGLLIHFPPNELKFGLAVLKGIYQVVKADFIQNCINDLEAHLKPKQLPMINYFHWCKNCGRDIDERDDNTMCITKDGDAKWMCRVCKPLKSYRPK